MNSLLRIGKLLVIGLALLSTAYAVELWNNQPGPQSTQHDWATCACSTCNTVRRMNQELPDRRLPAGDIGWAGPRL